MRREKARSETRLRRMHVVSLQITGGYFQRNAADSGGFLFKEGSGNASCSGALISENVAADGGALYAIDDATLEWQCDLRTNYAVTGSSM